MRKHENWYGPAKYQIKVTGQLGKQWSDWFDGMTITCKEGVTIITSDVLDQSALHGLLLRIRDLGLPLLSVMRFETEAMVERKEDEK